MNHSGANTSSAQGLASRALGQSMVGTEGGAGDSGRVGQEGIVGSGGDGSGGGRGDSGGDSNGPATGVLGSRVTRATLPVGVDTRYANGGIRRSVRLKAMSEKAKNDEGSVKMKECRVVVEKLLTAESIVEEEEEECEDQKVKMLADRG